MYHVALTLGILYQLGELEAGNQEPQPTTKNIYIFFLPPNSCPFIFTPPMTSLVIFHRDLVINLRITSNTHFIKGVSQRCHNTG